MVSRRKQIKVGQSKNPNDRRTAAYWMQDDNPAVLTGLALQCRSLGELAEMLGVHEVTVRNWRVKHPEIKEAIDIGREQADAAIIRSTFMDAVTTDGPSRRLWWQYRIAAKEGAYASKQYGVQQVDDAPVIIINRKGDSSDG